MAVSTSTGLVYSISAALPGSEDKAGYDALTWTVVGEVVSLGEYGASQEEVNHTPLATGLVEKYKGATNNGSLAVELGNDATDAGQVLLLAGSSGAAKFTVHSHKIAYPSGEIDAFQGLIFGLNKNPGAINSIVSAATNIGINTSIVDIQ